MVRLLVRSVFAGALALLCAGCGPEAAVWLRIEAPLKVPDHCDELKVEARWDDAAGEIAYERTYTLTDRLQFPLTLTLTAEDVGRSTTLSVTATGHKGGEVAPPGENWATATDVVPIQPGRITELTLRMRRP